MAKFKILSNTCDVDGNLNITLAEELLKYDYSIVENPKDANFIVFFTCGSTTNGIEESMKKLDEVASVTNAKILLAGCATFYDKFNEHYENNPQFKIFKGYNSLNDIYNYILHDELNFEENMDSKMHFINDSNTYMTLPIERGCNNSCSFCKYNYLGKGVESIKYDDLIKYVNLKLDKGLRSVILLGTNLTQYGIDEFNKPMLHKVISEISKDSRLNSIKVVALTPNDMYKELEDELLNNPKVTSVSMDLETFDNELLKRLNRGYTKEDCEYYAKKFKDAYKGFSTVLMSGLPGESYPDLVENINFCLDNDIFISKVHELIDSDEIPLSNNYERMDAEKKQAHTRFLKNNAIESNMKIFNKKYLNTLREGLITANSPYYEDTMLDLGTVFTSYSMDEELKNKEEGEVVDVKIVEGIEAKIDDHDLLPMANVKVLKR